MMGESRREIRKKPSQGEVSTKPQLSLILWGALKHHTGRFVLSFEERSLYQQRIQWLGDRSIGLVRETGNRASGKKKQSCTKGFEEITSTMPGAPKR